MLKTDWCRLNNPRKSIHSNNKQLHFPTLARRGMEARMELINPRKLFSELKITTFHTQIYSRIPTSPRRWSGHVGIERLFLECSRRCQRTRSDAFEPVYEQVCWTNEERKRVTLFCAERISNLVDWYDNQSIAVHKGVSTKVDMCNYD
jgi:hypothetical protein